MNLLTASSSQSPPLAIISSAESHAAQRSHTSHAQGYDESKRAFHHSSLRICIDNFLRRVPSLSGATSHGEVHLAVVRRNSCRLDDLHAVFSTPAAGWLPVFARSVHDDGGQNPGHRASWPAGPVCCCYLRGNFLLENAAFARSLMETCVAGPTRAAHPGAACGRGRPALLDLEHNRPFTAKLVFAA